jgi:parallel beta-helix repeat protein
MQTDDEALVQGLTLRCHATLTNQKKHAVEISMGRLKLIECDITSDTLACVAISGHSTHPEIQSCRLHDANGSGLLIERNAQGTIENCCIFGNSYPNIAIRQYADPVIRKCKIYGGKNHGILVWEYGTGTIEDCDIFGNAYDGVKAKDGGRPIVRGCRIYGNARQEGWIYYNGLGNTSFPKITETTGIRQQRGNPETRSEAISTSVKYTTENAAPQQEVAQQPGKRPNLINLFLRSIRFSKEKGSPSFRGKQSKNWRGGREQRDCPSLDLVRKTIKLRRTNLAKPAYHRRDCQQRSNSGAIRPGRVAYCEPGMARKWNDQG